MTQLMCLQLHCSYLLAFHKSELLPIPLMTSLSDYKLLSGLEVSSHNNYMIL